MVVITIIAILMGLIIGATQGAQSTAKFQQAKAMVAALETVCEEYKLELGDYPVAGECAMIGKKQEIAQNLYRELAGGPDSKSYVTALNLTKRNLLGAQDAQYIVDPWGEPYGYCAGGSDINPAFPKPAIWSTVGGAKRPAWAKNWVDSEADEMSSAGK